MRQNNDWVIIMRKGFLTAAILAAGIAGQMAVPSQAVQADDLSADEKKAIEGVIHNYLLNNPEVVVEAIRKFQAAQESARAEAALQRLGELREPLERNEGTPVIGNADGDVTIVEFFDYRCGYCKRVHEALTEAVNADGKVRLVLKEFPILGPESVTATKAALGVFYTAPDKYPDFHEAMMTSRGKLDEARVMELAVSVGLKADAVKAAMKDPRVELEIQHNMALAQALDISGTPAFVVGDELVPGAIDRAAFDELIKKARGS